MANPPLIVGNWKMNGTVEETLKMITELRHKLAPGTAQVAVAPPFTSLYSAAVALQDTPIKLAAQNMHWETEGPYTGEISGLFLKEIGCAYAIIGHSERRQYFGETDEAVNRKIRTALAQELVPIFCVGETAEQRKSGKTEAVLETQLKKGLQGFQMNDVKNMVIAYEPVWAIGTGKTATPETVREAHAFIKSLHDTRVLYGGSVKPENAADLLAQPGVDGALVGGASLDPGSFEAICRTAASLS